MMNLMSQDHWMGCVCVLVWQFSNKQGTMDNLDMMWSENNRMGSFFCLLVFFHLVLSHKTL